jgi:acetyltransferase-like isoleucine patch superfamily enzyme
MIQTSFERTVSPWLGIVRSLVQLARYAIVRLTLRRKLQAGRNVTFGRKILLRPPQFVRLGDNVHIASYFITEANLEVGSDVLISTRVACIGNDHAFDDASKTICEGGRLPPSLVVIEGDNLIGFGAILIGNVRVGRGCIVGAGSVVVSDLPPYWVCAGVPARPIRRRYAGKDSPNSEAG